MAVIHTTIPLIKPEKAVFPHPAYPTSSSRSCRRAIHAWSELMELQAVP